MNPYILAIESSCDDTSVAVLHGNKVLSNIVYTQKIHEEFGVVVPELASRNHEQKIVLTVQKALQVAQINKKEIQAIAFTKGPGLIGSLLVGVCFAKSLALALNIPLIEVNHMQAHVLSPYIEQENVEFPALSLIVSGGHTQLVYIKDYLDMEIIGQTIDDAAGEAFDKAAKMLKLEYPGGPLIDKHAKNGNPKAFEFSKSKIDQYDFSFSGVKTSILYFLQKQTQLNPNFIQENLEDLCASIQYTIVSNLIQKAEKAAKNLNVKHISLAGGVSANSSLRTEFVKLGEKLNIPSYIPSFQYCTDNAAMIGFVGHFLYEKQIFSHQEAEPLVKNYVL